LLLKYGTIAAESALAALLLNPRGKFSGKGQRNGYRRFRAEINGIDLQCKLLDQADNPLSDGPNLKPIFCVAEWSAYQSYVAIDLGNHIRSGRISRAIVSEFLSLCAQVGEGLNAQAVIWTPANLVSGFRYFAESVEQYQTGGPFPILALVDFQIHKNSGAFEMRSDGQAVVSSGLSWFSDQELAISSDRLTIPELLRRAVHIARDVASNGAIVRPMQIDGLDENEMLMMQPSIDLKMLHVTVSSKMGE
ncbi:MAG: hypothetical protein KA252_04035, partial [Sphingorhabdus sp.]|nr:hypothetical protein [Sphingorhabdus sp.]